jgi:nucleoside-diphosphate-sugar epimerase
MGNTKAFAGKIGTFDPKEKRAVLLGSGTEKVSFTTMADVGKLLVAALKTPQKSSPRTLKVNSYTATPNEILAEFEKQTDAKWEVEYTSLDELKNLEKKAYEDKSPMATVFTLRRIWTEGGTLYDERDNGKVGDPACETLAQQVKMVLEKETSSS